MRPSALRVPSPSVKTLRQRRPNRTPEYIVLFFYNGLRNCIFLPLAFNGFGGVSRMTERNERERDFTFNPEPSTHGRASINKKRSRWVMESLESRQEPAALLCRLSCSGLFIFCCFGALTVFVSFPALCEKMRCNIQCKLIFIYCNYDIMTMG